MPRAYFQRLSQFRVSEHGGAQGVDPHSVDLDDVIARRVKLHGHLGPFLVVGIRMGLLALKLFSSPGYFGITAVSETGSRTPLSCLTDGIQLGSGCTASA